MMNRRARRRAAALRRPVEVVGVWMAFDALSGLLGCDKCGLPVGEWLRLSDGRVVCFDCARSLKLKFPRLKISR